MQDVTFQSQLTATYNGKIYPVVIFIDYVLGVASFQDSPYHPSEVLTRPLNEVVLAPVITPDIKAQIIAADIQEKADAAAKAAETPPDAPVEGALEQPITP